MSFAVLCWYKPMSCANSHLVATVPISRPSLNLRSPGTGNRWLSLGDEILWYNHNQCRFSCAFICHVNLFLPVVLDVQIVRCWRSTNLYSNHFLNGFSINVKAGIGPTLKSVLWKILGSLTTWHPEYAKPCAIAAFVMIVGWIKHVPYWWFYKADRNLKQ